MSWKNLFTSVIQLKFWVENKFNAHRLIHYLKKFEYFMRPKKKKNIFCELLAKSSLLASQDQLI